MFLYVFYWISRTLESIWGSFRFNRYYFSGILLTSLTALLVRVIAGQDYIMVTPYYINISLFLAAACLLPEERVLLFFIIPIKMRILALIDVGMVILELAQEYSALHSVYPAGRLIALLCVAPVIALLNFLLFLRGDVRNLSPRFAGRRVRKRDFVKTDARFTDEDRRRADAVVGAQGGAVGAYPLTVDDSLDGSGLEVEALVVALAHHVHMALQDHCRSVLVAGGGRFAQYHITDFVGVGFDAVSLSKIENKLADFLLFFRGARYFGDLVEDLKHRFGL